VLQRNAVVSVGRGDDDIAADLLAGVLHVDQTVGELIEVKFNQKTVATASASSLPVAASTTSGAR
jgi:hypothetical protein